MRDNVSNAVQGTRDGSARVLQLALASNGHVIDTLSLCDSFSKHSEPKVLRRERENRRGRCMWEAATDFALIFPSDSGSYIMNASRICTGAR